MAWNTRFKQISAARRRAATTAASPRVTDAAVTQARAVSPAAFLSRHYPSVKVNSRGDAIEIDGVLRADRKGDTWVSCDWHANAIGDNITLARQTVPGLSFVEAVQELLGSTPATVVPKVAKPLKAVKANAGPKLPPVAAEAAGRAYLNGRGISNATIDAAVNAGALGWCENGVLFLGRDHAQPGRPVRAATIRFFVTTDIGGGKLATKRDLVNSDKSFPVLLPGASSHVVVAEGGVTGLAVQDLALLRGEPAPTVIVTGGANIRGWLTENLPLRERVQAADYVAIAGENEIDRDGSPAPLKQMRTDSARQHLARLIAEARDGEFPDITYPPAGVKDAAEWLRVLTTDDRQSCGGAVVTHPPVGCADLEVAP